MISSAVIWGWGDDFKDAKINCEKYVSKKWRENTKEGCIYLTCREWNEGIGVDFAAYTSDKEKVGDLAERLLYIAAFDGNAKVYSIRLLLFDSIISGNEVCRHSMEEVESELRKREHLIAERFINDPEVKEVAQGKKVVFIPRIDLLCELESRYANKLVVEVVHEDFKQMKKLLESVCSALIKEGLATRVLGYRLGKSIDDMKVRYVYIWGDEVLVRIV
ncbi:MAG: hypothetical protein ACP5M7_10085 [Thermoproteota archaeon]